MDLKQIEFDFKTGKGHLYRFKTEEEFNVREYPELKKFLENYEKYFLEEGYFDYRSHHGFEDKLTSKIQKRCFKILRSKNIVIGNKENGHIKCQI